LKVRVRTFLGCDSWLFPPNGTHFPHKVYQELWRETSLGAFRPIPVPFCHMPLTREDVVKLADLARLELSEAEISSAEGDLEAILDFVESLQGIDTKNTEPMTMPPKAEGWREDAAMPCDELARELILANFPARRGDLLSAPAVFANPKGK
jgi:aspartyl-tRNA(Asn)/glutamyl-tRNA(Gln) amidotransferase subunit C